MGQFATGGYFAHMPFIREIVYGAVGRGALLKELCEGLGLSVADLHDSDRPVAFDKCVQVWELAAAATRDPLLGLHLGEQTGPAIMGLVGHLMQNSATLLEAFQKVEQYNQLVTNLFSYRVAQSRDTITLCFEPLPQWQLASPLAARHATEQAMAGTLHVFELLAGKMITPVAASFAWPRAGEVQEYERVFPCVIRFKASRNELQFSVDQLASRVFSYDQSLFYFFDELLRKRAAGRNATRTLAEQITDLVYREFKGQVPPAEIAAARLNTTVRSMQRKLEGEGTSYRALAARLRMEVAQQLLERDHSKVSEVARHLGYADASSFRRAFKNWTQTTPSQAKR
jgi:AraC-like DNA-binding protein